MRTTGLLYILLSLAGCSPRVYDMVFVSDRNGSMDTYLTKSDTSLFRQITNTPDDKWVAFSKTIKGNSEIYFISPRHKRSNPVIVSAYRDEIEESDFH